MTGNNFRLVTLGRLALLDDTGQVVNPVSKRRRKLALLAYLALSRRPVPRDQLVEMFWGEQDEKRARHSLSDALSELRGHLGAEAIEARTTDLALGAKAPLTLDLREFQGAVDAKDWARAVTIYQGPLLHGVVVENSSSFEDWVMRERDRLAQLFARACKEHIPTLMAGGRWQEAGALAERWIEAAPLSADAAIALLAALRAPGGSAAAQEAHAAYERFVAMLSRDYDMEPDPRVATYAAQISDEATLAGSPPAPEPVTRPLAPALPAPNGRWRLGTAITLGIAILSGLIFTVRRPASSGRPAVAVVLIRNLGTDTGAAWLQDGLRQMITSDLARSAAIDVVAPERVHGVLERAGLQGHAELSDEELRRVGREVGATWVVTGAFTRGDNIYVLDVGLHSTRSSSAMRLYTVAGPDPLAVADGAAARVLDAVDAGGPGPRFASLETSSLEAYQHWIRWSDGVSRGQFAESRRELDMAIALDSNFVSALIERMRGALLNNEPGVLAALRRRFDAARNRASPWDVMELEAEAALHEGDHDRAERLARELVARFPRDPRSYNVLATAYSSHGKWDASDSVLRQELALDSLATEAGHGPCAPCSAYSGLLGDQMNVGHLADGERTARRWVALQPDIPASWTGLSAVLSFEGKFDGAIDAARRAAALAPEDADYRVRIGRVMLQARRYAEVDSAIAGWRAEKNPEVDEASMDLQALLERERGQFRASIATIERGIARYPGSGVLRLEEGNSLSRVGRWQDARRIYEGHGVHLVRHGDLLSRYGLNGDEARAFCWSHALEADAIAGFVDTTVLAALADSIDTISRRSYYARDWGLAHHVRGLIAEQRGHPADAAREFRQARFGTAGWTRTNLHLALAELALGHVDSAITVLRDAYAAPLDAMGRYQPRSELDYYMAMAFRHSARPDSAAVYERYVREAWAHAEPESRERLARLNEP